MTLLGSLGNHTPGVDGSIGLRRQARSSKFRWRSCEGFTVFDGDAPPDGARTNEESSTQVSNR